MAHKAVLQTLAPFPLRGSSQIFSTGDDSFLIVSESSHWYSNRGIYRYSTHSNQWDMIMHYDRNLWIENNCVAFDASKRIIYAIVGGRRLIQFDLNSKTAQKLQLNLSVFSPKVICAEGVIHLIVDHKHYIFDNDRQTMQLMHTFDGENRPFIGDIFHLKSRNKLLVFGKDLVVHQYQIWNEQWIKNKIKVASPRIIYNFLKGSSSVCSANDEYIITFGGEKSRMQWTDSIFIYNIHTNTMRVSPVRCPVPSIFKPVLMRNEKRDELLVFGFVNRCFALSEYQNIQRLPLYLIRLIAEWISNEYIHLINNFTGVHWIIHIDQILESDLSELAESKMSRFK